MKMSQRPESCNKKKHLEKFVKRSMNEGWRCPKDLRFHTGLFLPQIESNLATDIYFQGVISCHWQLDSQTDSNPSHMQSIDRLRLALILMQLSLQIGHVGWHHWWARAHCLGQDMNEKRPGATSDNGFIYIKNEY